MGSFGRDRLPPGHDFDFTTDAPTTSNHTVDRTERFGIRAAVAGRGGARVLKQMFYLTVSNICLNVRNGSSRKAWCGT
jgi:hypothetical protein